LQIIHRIEQRAQKDWHDMEVTMIADYACEVGECPVWHPLDQTLYWVDIPRGHLFRYHPETGRHERIYEAGRTIGGLCAAADGSLLLFLDKGAVWRWRDGAVTVVQAENPLDADTRFNDAIADPQGRVFTGTMGGDARRGRLYRFNLNARWTIIREGIGISNGMGFSPDRTRFYHTDSVTRTIDVYDYDESTGEALNRRPFITLPDGGGVPDGMAVDAEGCVWSAVWDGSCVIRFDPDGRELLRIPVPARKASSAAFGGANLDELYVTTAGVNNRPDEGDHAGALFRVTGLIARGQTPNLARIGGADHAD
jgi:D-xylonolactonase